MFLGLTTKSLSAIGGAVLLVGVVIGTAAVMANDNDFGTIDAPDWQSGYAWTYDVSGEFEYVANVPGEFSDSGGSAFGPFKLKKEILNTEDFVVDGESLFVGATTLPIGHILEGMVFDYADGGWAELEMFPTADRQRDLAPVPVWPTYSQGSVTGLSFGDASFIPEDYIEFPLTYGKRWSDSVEFDELVAPDDDLGELAGITEVKMTAEAGKLETLQLPIGTTKAVRLDFSYQPVGLQKAVAQAREEAESYGIDVERLTVQMGLHEIAHYSPEYQAVVRDQFVLSALVDAVFSFQGDRIEFFTEFTAYTVAELTGAKLDAEPERSMEEIIAKLEGREPIKDATGQNLDPASLYAIDLVASQSRVNAADSPVVTFSVDTDRADGLPAGHSLEYLVKDYAGKIVQSGDASSAFNLKFDDAGSYTVIVAALNEDGALVSKASTPVTADYQKASYATCQVYATMFSSDCGSAAVPARAGLDRLIIEAQVNKTLPSLGQDRIELRDADGSIAAYGYHQGNGLYRIELDGDEIDKARADALVRYIPEIGAYEEVTYTVQAFYDVASPSSMTVHQEAGLMVAMRDFRAMQTLLAPVDAALGELVEGKSLEAQVFDTVW